MRYLYSLLFYLALPFIFLRLLWRSRKNPLYRKRLAERLGFCPHRLNQCIWVHAVSLGETIAAHPLIKALKIKYPHIPILVTNMTLTGSVRVAASLGDSVLNAYIPYDVPDAVARFIDRVHPKILVIMETELWPNLFAACKKRNIPIVLTNARLSNQSAKGYHRIKPLVSDMLTAITVLSAQAEPDASRFIELGMEKNRVKMTGSLKFDLEILPEVITKGKALRNQLGDTRLIWVAASTHNGEEEIILAAHRIIHQKLPNVLLILVPRHPERFDDVAKKIKEQGFHLVRRSEKNPCSENTAVYLGDTMGEMLLMYAASDVTFVGGSFVPIGGHNVIEPAALHKPVITGPYLFNFAEVSDLMLAANGMIKVEDAEQLSEKVIHFFMDEETRKKTGDNAFQVVEKNRGALKRQVDLINLG
ncbi:MAG: hypothetical protein ACD_60C00105G0001 [uncultured bacterium]|nr:MAG: hypothetical protein ACD_60C00105G0001 [uncultured bacterium]